MSEFDRHRSIELQDKLYLLLLAICLTTLSVSVQTAKLGEDVMGAILELLSWVLLSISSVIGLERMFSVFDYLAKSDDVERAAAQGRVEFALRAKEIVDAKGEKIDRHFKYHKWTFYIGALMLFISRAYLTMVKLISCQ